VDSSAPAYSKNLLTLAILKPLKEATMLLQGHIGGKASAIWQVIPQYDKMLSHFERLSSSIQSGDPLTQAFT